MHLRCEDNQDLILPFQIIEFDLKGTPLDSSSFIDVVVKDYETIGKDKYVCIHHCLNPLWILTSHKMASMVKEKIFLYISAGEGGVGGILHLMSGCGGFPCNHFTLCVNITEVEITAV